MRRPGADDDKQLPLPFIYLPMPVAPHIAGVEVAFSDIINWGLLTDRATNLDLSASVTGELFSLFSSATDQYGDHKCHILVTKPFARYSHKRRGEAEDIIKFWVAQTLGGYTVDRRFTQAYREAVRKLLIHSEDSSP